MGVQVLKLQTWVRAGLPYKVERTLSVPPEAEDREIVVEGSDPLDSQAQHYREAGTVHNGRILVGRVPAECEGRPKIGSGNWLDARRVGRWFYRNHGATLALESPA